MYGDDILAKTNNLKKSTKDQYSFINTGNLTGTGIGVIVGVAIAYNQKVNLFLGGVIGGIIGGVATNYFVNRSNQ